MKLLLDTNRYTDFARGDSVVVDPVQSATKIFSPFIVLGELRRGFLAGTQARENQATLARVLQRPTVSTRYADGETTHHYAAIYSQLRGQGTPVPTNDLWIAALGVQHELIPFTRNPYFKHIPQLAQN